ncbi:MAG: hypothetical protein Q7R81_02960 [Candidatus Peregrinibacteria bacterium]|nr:hypothetical protein [Candidatus Peregrinibacteria bacterium]
MDLPLPENSGWRMESGPFTLKLVNENHRAPRMEVWHRDSGICLEYNQWAFLRDARGALKMYETFDEVFSDIVDCESERLDENRDVQREMQMDVDEGRFRGWKGHLYKLRVNVLSLMNSGRTLNGLLRQRVETSECRALFYAALRDIVSEWSSSYAELIEGVDDQDVRMAIEHCCFALNSMSLTLSTLKVLTDRVTAVRQRSCEVMHPRRKREKR